MNREDIDTERGDEEIVFVSPQLDMEEISEEDEPRELIEEKVEEKGLEWEDARIIGLFQDEFSLMLDEGGAVFLEGEEVYTV